MSTTKKRRYRRHTIHHQDAAVRFALENPKIHLDEIAEAYDASASTISYWLRNRGYSRRYKDYGVGSPERDAFLSRVGSIQIPAEEPQDRSWGAHTVVSLSLSGCSLLLMLALLIQYKWG